MVHPTDIKWQINDELEAILHLVQRLEGDVKKAVPRSPEQKRLMSSLLRVEEGVHKARRELGK